MKCLRKYVVNLVSIWHYGNFPTVMYHKLILTKSSTLWWVGLFCWNSFYFFRGSSIWLVKGLKGATGNFSANPKKPLTWLFLWVSECFTKKTEWMNLDIDGSSKGRVLIQYWLQHWRCNEDAVLSKASRLEDYHGARSWAILVAKWVNPFQRDVSRPRYGEREICKTITGMLWSFLVLGGIFVAGKTYCC